MPAKITMVLAIAAFAVMTATAAAAGAWVTDLRTLPEPPLPALPPAGGTVVDPTFGTTILRVTDATTFNGRECVNAYAYWPTFNRDSTRLWALCGTTGILYDFAPATLALSNKRPLFASPSPSGYTVAEDTIWSAADPNVVFTHDATHLWAYDVTSGVFTLVKDLADVQPALLLHQMSRSIDDDVFAFTTKDAASSAITGYVVYRRSDDSYPLRVTTNRLDEVQLDKSGRYLYVKPGRLTNDPSEVRNRVFDLTTGAVEDLTYAAPDYSVGHSDSGTGMIAGFDGAWNNRIVRRSLASPHAYVILLPFYNDWAQGLHVSALADDERWALGSSQRNFDLPWGPFHNEIYQFAIDGSQRIRRLAHHRSEYRGYWDSPRADISRDARFIAFTSNWGGSSRQDMFVLVAPATGMCGDGTLDLGEQCEDGNTVDGDGCDSSCTPTACGNGIVTAGEQCDDGNLAAGDCCGPTCALEPADSVCDDSDLCTTTDRCDATGNCVGAAVPAGGCRTAAVGSLTIRAGNKSSVAWKWSRGAATTVADFGNPASGGDDHALCVYDEVGTGFALRLHVRLPAGGTCSGKPCWRTKSNGFSYKSRDGYPDGVTAATFKAGADGAASMLVKGRGRRLPVANLPFEQQNRVTVQLRSSAGACWTTELPSPPARNTAEQFKDRWP